MTSQTVGTERRWTWTELIKVEPELGSLYAIVPRTVRLYLLPGRASLRDVVGFVEGFSAAWQRARGGYAITHVMTDNLDWLVGWHCHRPELATSQAYDVAYHHIARRLDAEELLVKAEVDAWLAHRPSADNGPAWEAWLLDRPWFDPDATPAHATPPTR